MEHRFERPYLTRHPIKALILVTIVLAIVSLILMFTVVGTIVALPLMALAAVTGLLAWYKFHRHWHKGHWRH